MDMNFGALKYQTLNMIVFIQLTLMNVLSERCNFTFEPQNYKCQNRKEYKREDEFGTGTGPAPLPLPCTPTDHPNRFLDRV